MITILIRTADRPTQFKRCINSILYQTYKKVRILVYDNSIGECYTNEWKDYLVVGKSQAQPKDFEYNPFLNDMKDWVLDDDFFIVIDDDDCLECPYVLQELSEHLIDHDELVIFQFQRNARKKPSDKQIESKTIKCGHIGMPCFALSGKHRNIAYFDSTEQSDFNFIKEVSQKLKTKFVKLVVAHAGARSFGKKE